MNVRMLALVPYPLDRAPGQRYRIEQWAPSLKKLGVDVEFAPFLDEEGHDALYGSRTLKKVAGVLRAALRNAERRTKASRADAIFVFREASLIGRGGLEKRLAALKPLIFDFDDAIWLPQEGSVNRRWSWLRSPEKARDICRVAAAVTVGNGYLRDWAAKTNQRVEVLPSSIDLRSYGDPRAHHAVGRVVGWMGSHSTVGYLKEIMPAVAQAARAMPLKLLVVGASVAPVEGLEVECRPWKAEREADDLREMDIGLMPLPDNQWTRGKCAMKAIQYLSVGVPAVASPVGTNRDVVLPGRTGMLAANSAEWGNAIRELLLDPDRRQTYGKAGRSLIENEYTADVQAARLARVVKEVLRVVA